MAADLARHAGTPILPDVNVLVYAYRREASAHDVYAEWLDRVSGQGQVLLADVVCAGFARIVTNARILREPSTIREAMDFLTALRGRSSLAHGSPRVWNTFSGLCADDQDIRGNLVPDAYLAAIALSHGARLATKDRGFSRFPGLRTFDPGSSSTP